MFPTISSLLLIIFLVLIGILLIRAYQFKPIPMESITPKQYQLNRDNIVSNMIKLIQCKTISYHDTSLINREEYEKLYTILEEQYPLVHRHCKREFIDFSGILYTWNGKNDTAPIVCMSHYDVVPIDTTGWTKPAFDGILENDILWGRGTLDTKGTLCSILEAVEYLLAQGFIPQQTIYLSFSGDEETAGTSCPAIVDTLQSRGITPALVLDEGGAVVENVFPGVTKECALIGIGEKGLLNVDFNLKSQGGHASTPPKHTPVGEMAIAIHEIETHPFSSQFTTPVLSMFDTLGRYSHFHYRLLFGNLWCFKPLLAIICKYSGGELNAMLHTTCAMTRMSGSDTYNVIPPDVSAGANLRLLGNDTVESAVAHLRTIITNKQIEITTVSGTNPSKISKMDGKEWNQLKEIIHGTWPDAIIAPYLMMACSDSRHFCRICDHVYRFSPMKLSKEERLTIHGNDERIPISTLMKTVEFYIRFLEHC